MSKNNKEIESKSKADKQVAQLKFKGNQHQFEHNASVEALLVKAKMENAGENEAVDTVLDEAKLLIRKRQKLIRLADKSQDGWKELIK
ncbi:hypothetical protein AC249_AIPGENE16291 [Exaiptasia diaphana]|nr:hypothetical protein AC249_AIPGENE16291 [Exaiptasia diaphana]